MDENMKKSMKTMKNMNPFRRPNDNNLSTPNYNGNTQMGDMAVNPMGTRSNAVVGGRRTRRRRSTRKRQSKPMVNLQANRKRTRAVAVRGKRGGRISKR